MFNKWKDFSDALQEKISPVCPACKEVWMSTTNADRRYSRKTSNGVFFIPNKSWAAGLMMCSMPLIPHVLRSLALEYAEFLVSLFLIFLFHLNIYWIRLSFACWDPGMYDSITLTEEVAGRKGSSLIICHLIKIVSACVLNGPWSVFTLLLLLRTVFIQNMGHWSCLSDFCPCMRI